MDEKYNRKTTFENICKMAAKMYRAEATENNITPQMIVEGLNVMNELYTRMLCDDPLLRGAIASPTGVLRIGSDAERDDIEKRAKSVNTINKFHVGTIGQDIIIDKLQVRLDKQDAIALAAWLVIVADDAERFMAHFLAIKCA